MQREWYAELGVLALVAILGVLSRAMPSAAMDLLYGLFLMLALLLLLLAIAPASFVVGGEQYSLDMLAVIGFTFVNVTYVLALFGIRADGGWLLAVPIGILILVLVCVRAAREGTSRSPLGALGLHSYWARVSMIFLFLMLFAVLIAEPLFRWAFLVHPAIVAMIALAVLALVAFGTPVHYLKRVRSLYAAQRTMLLGLCGLFVVRLTGDMLVSILASALAVRAVLAQFDTLLLLVGLCSVLGTLLLALLPAWIWFAIVRIRTTGSHEHLPNWPGWLTGIVLALIWCAARAPILHAQAGEQGVTFAIEYFPAVSMQTFWIALGIFALCAIMGAAHDHVRRLLMSLPFFASIIFLGIVSYESFVGLFAIQSLQIAAQMNWLGILTVPALLVVLIVSAIAMISGYIVFLYEVARD